MLDFLIIEGMIRKKDILDFIETHKADLENQFHLSKIGIFGSYARGEETPNSDIDLIVEFKSGTQNLYQVKQALKEFFRHQFQKEVDVCREKYIQPYYKKKILADAIFV